MYINILDQLFNEILNKFNVFLNKKKIISKFKNDVNFVKFQNEILILIKNFLNIILKDKKINDKIKKAVDKKNMNYIHGIIERYTAYYIYLTIAYYYKGGRDLFITNLIESSKNQKTSNISIPNFFNSENNSRIINYFSDIKNILSLLEFKTIDRINVVIENAPSKYENVQKIINELGSDYFETFFMMKDNYHNIIKTFIFRLLYLLNDRNIIIDILNQKEKNNSEYKFIEITLAKDDKIADFTIIQDFLFREKVNLNLANDIYSYVVKYNKDEKKIKKKEDYFNYLFEKKIFVPISQDFLRYHKDNYKYDTASLLKEDIKQRDATKIKFIINKINKVKSYYSEVIENNPIKKKKILELFYKNLDWKKTVLYNDNEEIKIIQKLEQSDKTDDIDLLIDLENIRKYSYINYKKIDGYGLKLRPINETQAIRNTNFLRVNLDKCRNLELRMGNNSLPLNINGIVYNPLKKPLECYKNKDLYDVKKLYDSKNGFKSFSKILNDTISKNKDIKDKLYYWKFNNLTDIIESSSYKNVTKKMKNYLDLFAEEIYFQYFNNIKDRLINLANENKNLTIWAIKNLFNKINNNVLNLKNSKSIYNEIEFAFYKNLIDVEYKEKSPKIIDSKDIIKLLKINNNKEKKYVEKINIKEIGDNVDLTSENVAICNHYLEWNNINKISNKNINEKNQLIFDFVKKYVKENDQKDYVCKSCGEMLKLKKYVFEGTYVKELDIFLTTSLATHQKLEEIPKYSKFIKIIKNLTKNLESISSTLNFIGLIGNTPSIVLRKKMIIQNVIDTILLNTKYIRNIGDETKKNISKLSNITLSNAIFFDLNDSIYITRSDDVDKLKILKYNNIISYLILFIIIDMNEGMILSIKEDKKFNYYLFERLKEKIFGDIKLRIDEKTNIKVINLPIFAYVLYMVSANVAFSSIWYSKDFDIKKVPLYQLTIIQTVVDLFNIIINAYFSKEIKIKNIEGNYLFEILAQRFMNKIKKLYNDNILKEILKKKGEQSIKKENNKIIFKTKKVQQIYLPNKYIEIDLHTLDKNDTSVCISTTKKMNKSYNNYDIDFLDEFTNCPEGDFHEWGLNGNKDLVCQKCNANFSDLSKKFNDNTTTEKDNISIIEKVKMKKLKLLTKNYCLDGKTHDLDKNKRCKLCKLNPFEHKYTNKELLKLEKSLELKKIELSVQEMKKIKNQLKKNKEKKGVLKSKLNQFNSKYYEKTKNNFREYVNKFTDKLIKISGNKIKVNNKEIYININKFIIRNDFLGKSINKPIELLFSNNFNFGSNDLQKYISKYYHPNIKKLVYCYYNRKQKYYMFYDCNNLIYLGYSNSLKTIKFQRSSFKLIIEPSIKEKILSLGLKNNYINLIEKNQDFLNMNNQKIKNKINSKLINSIIRERIFNIKQIIQKTISILEKINNKEKVSKINSDENNIVKEFSKIIKHINLQDKDGYETVFKNFDYIINDMKFEKINFERYKIDELLYFNPFPILDITFLEKLNNLDNKLIFYLIYNFNKILKFNDSNQIVSLVNYLIIRLIDFNYYQFKEKKEILELDRFKAFIYSDQPFIDNYLRVEGVYKELIDSDEEMDDEQYNQMMDNIESVDALDIDDYEDDDPEGDNYMEALNYEFD